MGEWENGRMGEWENGRVGDKGTKRQRDRERDRKIKPGNSVKLLEQKCKILNNY
jgi:hypothetical protein